VTILRRLDESRPIVRRQAREVRIRVSIAAHGRATFRRLPQDAGPRPAGA